jgi:predicted PurR-regulated permease PerM
LDILRNLFGGVTSTIFRLIVVFGTMAAIYFFAIKPALDTTEEISRSISNPIQQAQQQIDTALQQQGVNPGDGNIPNTTQITRTLSGLTPAQAEALTECLQRAGSDLGFINDCFDRFERQNRQQP